MAGPSTVPSPVQPERGTWAHHLSNRGLMQCESGACQRKGPWQSDPWLLKMANMIWNVTCLVVKESEFMKDERYQIDLVELISTYSLGSGSSLLSYAGVIPGKRQMAGLGLPIVLQLSASTVCWSLSQ